MHIKDKENKVLKSDLSDHPCVCFNLRKASRIITQIYDAALRPLGCRATQITILLAIQKMQPISVSDLAEAISTDRTTLTRNLRPLERKGLISIHCGKDKRQKEVVLNLEGHRTLDKALPVWEKIQIKVAKAVGKNRLDQLLKDLTGILQGIQKL